MQVLLQISDPINPVGNSFTGGFKKYPPQPQENGQLLDKQELCSTCVQSHQLGSQEGGLIFCCVEEELMGELVVQRKNRTMVSTSPFDEGVP